MADTGSLIVKDPQSSGWPRGIDWTNYLAQIDAAETVVGSTWAVSGADTSLTSSSPSIVTGSKKTQVRLAGGTEGLRYTVTNTIVTSSGVTEERSFIVLVEQQ
jgi:hypothetical protein